MPPQVIKLVSGDNVTFEVPYKAACVLMLVRDLVNDLDGVGPELESIPLPSVDSKILQIVINYATHHQDDPSLSNEMDANQEHEMEPLGEWDKNLFTPLNHRDLREVLCAANYLDVKGLMAVVSRVFAKRLEGLTTEEMRDILFPIADALF